MIDRTTITTAPTTNKTTKENSAIYKEMRERLDHIVDDFLSIGVAVFHDFWGAAWSERCALRSSFAWRTFIRQLAKEQRRPCVMAYSVKSLPWKYDSTTAKWKRENSLSWHGYLSIPRRKYLQPIAAPLLLAAKPRSTNYQTYEGEHDLTLLDGKTNWCFTFHHDAGRALFTH